jgi:ABC-type Fe3+/spermidine/putrescine transport system ATPase subunit
VGSPEELYESPATRFVATFIGRASVLPATWSAARGEAVLGANAAWRAAGEPGLAEAQPVDLVVRPEGLEFASSAEPSALPGEIAGRRFAGRAAFFEVALASPPGGTVEVLAAPNAAAAGARVLVRPVPDGPRPRAYRRPA